MLVPKQHWPYRKLMAFALLAGLRICLFMGTDVFMRARLGEEKAQSTLPLLVFLSGSKKKRKNTSLSACAAVAQFNTISNLSQNYSYQALSSEWGSETRHKSVNGNRWHKHKHGPDRAVWAHVCSTVVTLNHRRGSDPKISQTNNRSGVKKQT